MRDDAAVLLRGTDKEKRDSSRTRRAMVQRSSLRRTTLFRQGRGKRRMPGFPTQIAGTPQTVGKPGATQATAVTLGAQAAFWNLSLAVRKAVI